MNSNEGRNIYLHEILVDYVKNTEEYSNENIKKKLKLYYDLQNKKNINKNTLSTEEKITLKKLDAFFSKTFELSFSDSKLIFPRFKEAYGKAKAAIANVKTAYDNVVTEYYNIANKGFYESKNPKFYDYLNYIKKKILIAKINAGIIQDIQPNKDTEEDDNLTKYIPKKLVQDENKDYNNDYYKKTNYNSGSDTSDEERDNKEKNDSSNIVEENEQIIGSLQNELLLNPQLLMPPPLLLLSSGGDNGQELNRLDIVKKSEKDDFKRPITLQEKYIIEEKYIEGVLTDFEDIDEFNKIIKKIGDYFTELNLFINGNEKTDADKAEKEDNDKGGSLYDKINSIKNFKKIEGNEDKDDNDNNIDSKLLQISSLKNEISSREKSDELIIYQDFYSSKTKTHEYIVYRDKYLKFLEKKIKEIYNKDIDEYIKNFPEIKKIINEDTKLITCINDLTKNIVEISKNFKQELSKYKKITEDIENNFKILQSNKNKLDLENKRGQYNRIYPYKTHRYDGSGIIKDSIKNFNKNRSLIEKKSKDLENIFKDIQKLLKLRNTDPFIKSALNNTSDGQPYVPGISIFDKIWKNYTTDIREGKQIIENIDDKLYTSVKNNDLDPSIVLELTYDDKLIFIIIIYFIRQISLGVVEYYIDNGKIKDIIFSLLYYVIFYVILIIMLTIFINLDNYKLRIIFNYFNLHINLYNILTHVFIIVTFSFLIYSLIVIINFPIQNLNQKYISERDKIKLAYRLEILTIIIFIFSAIFVLVL